MTTTNSITSKIAKNGKTLVFKAKSSHSDYVSKHIEAVVIEAFEKLAPHVQEQMQTLYITDNPELCAPDEYPLIDCINATETTITIRSWAVGRLNMKHLSLAVHQALFQIVRLQNVGYSATFGDEIFNRGLAAYYAHIMTGWTPPCGELEVTKKMRRMALRRWSIKHRNNSKWFVAGQQRELIGHAIGYELAEVTYGDGTRVPFALEHAIRAYGSWYADKLWALNHLRSMRSVLCLTGAGRRPFWSL